jgi:hypothetical protein
MEERMEASKQRMKASKQRMEALKQRMKAFKQEMEEFKQEYCEDVVVFSRSIIVTVAAEILLFAIDEQPNDQTKITEMMNLLKTDPSKIEKLVKKIGLPNSTEKFTKAFDQVIDLEDLDDKVAETHSLFERHEILKVKFKQEWFIIKNYECIKHQKLETM